LDEREVDLVAMILHKVIRYKQFIRL